MKYNISKDFGIFRNFHTTLNPLVLRIARVALSIFPKGMKNSKDLLIEKQISFQETKRKLKHT